MNNRIMVPNTLVQTEAQKWYISACGCGQGGLYLAELISE
jgi:hypothetical protein